MIKISSLTILIAWTVVKVLCQDDDVSIEETEAPIIVKPTKSTTTTTEGPTGPTKDPRLTGNPQNDYKYDLNLPRELKGYSLDNYPFYFLVPTNITFECKGHHDGYYASIEHMCQVYHYCVFGQRYDFLCANYTLFDQITFNCRFASSVNCSESEKHYYRNEPTTTTTLKPRRLDKGLYRRKQQQQEEEDDYYEYDDETSTTTKKPKRTRTPKTSDGSKRPKRIRTTTTAATVEEEYYDDPAEAASQPAQTEAPPPAIKTEKTTTAPVSHTVPPPTKRLLVTRPTLATPLPPEEIEELPTQRPVITRETSKPNSQSVSSRITNPLVNKAKADSTQSSEEVKPKLTGAHHARTKTFTTEAVQLEPAGDYEEILERPEEIGLAERTTSPRRTSRPVLPESRQSDQRIIASQSRNRAAEFSQSHEIPVEPEVTGLIRPKVSSKNTVIKNKRTTTPPPEYEYEQ